MSDTQTTHQYEQLIDIFNQCFSEDYNTRLVKGDDEPIYLPADDELPYHRIVFAHGFYASGLRQSRTGALPVKNDANWWISATGIAQMGAMRKRKANSKR